VEGARIDTTSGRPDLMESLQEDFVFCRCGLTGSNRTALLRLGLHECPASLGNSAEAWGETIFLRNHSLDVGQLIFLCPLWRVAHCKAQGPRVDCHAGIAHLRSAPFLGLRGAHTKSKRTRRCNAGLAVCALVCVSVCVCVGLKKKQAQVM
jgi:hypothetical protein